MEFLIVIAVVVALGAGVLFAKLPGAVPAAQLDVPDPRLPPSAQAWTPHDVTGIRFAVATRGYRMDQVDAAMAAFAEQLRRRDDELDRLRRSAVRADAPARTDATGSTDPTGSADIEATKLAAPGINSTRVADTKGAATDATTRDATTTNATTTNATTTGESGNESDRP